MNMLNVMLLIIFSLISVYEDNYLLFSIFYSSAVICLSIYEAKPNNKAQEDL